MDKNKYCCRIFPIILIIISLIISLTIWYFEERILSFSFLTDKDEIFNFLGTVLFIAIIPIGIFYWLNDKEKYQSRAKAISFLGFLPALGVFWRVKKYENYFKRIRIFRMRKSQIHILIYLKSDITKLIYSQK